jgi:hypothetical protein
MNSTVVTGTLRILFYLALGPLIGMLVGNLAIGFYTFAMTGSMRDFVLDASLFAPVNLIASYTLGLLPALLTAVIAIILRKPLSGLPYWLWIGLAGAVLSLILAWTVFGMAPIGDGLGPFFFIVIASAGGIAGLVCTALFDALGGLLTRGR